MFSYKYSIDHDKNYHFVECECSKGQFVFHAKDKRSLTKKFKEWVFKNFPGVAIWKIDLKI